MIRTLTFSSTRPAPIVPIPAIKKGTATWRVVWYHLSCLYALLPNPSVLLWNSGSGSEFATEEIVTIEHPLESVPPPRLGSDMSVLFFWPLGLFRPAIKKSIHLTLHRTKFQRHLIKLYFPESLWSSLERNTRLLKTYLSKIFSFFLYRNFLEFSFAQILKFCQRYNREMNFIFTRWIACFLLTLFSANADSQIFSFSNEKLKNKKENNNNRDIGWLFLLINFFSFFLQIYTRFVSLFLSFLLP